MRSLYRYVGSPHGSCNPLTSSSCPACIADRVSRPFTHTKMITIFSLLFLLIQGRLDSLPVKALYRFTVDPDQRGTAPPPRRLNSLNRFED